MNEPAKDNMALDPQPGADRRSSPLNPTCDHLAPDVVRNDIGPDILIPTQPPELPPSDSISPVLLHTLSDGSYDLYKSVGGGMFYRANARHFAYGYGS